MKTTFEYLDKTNDFLILPLYLLTQKILNYGLRNYRRLYSMWIMYR